VNHDMNSIFTGSATPLSPEGLDHVLTLLEVGAAEIWTVLAVETHGCGFLADRRPLILFERHIFHRLTAGVHDTAFPSISAPQPGGYLGGSREYDRLEQALALDRQAALDSASWGIGQIMGFNAPSAGYDSAEGMVTAMKEQEDAQILAMARFLKSQNLAASLAAHDWSAFARAYNGPNYRLNSYDTRLAGFFAHFSAGMLPNLTVRAAQVLLLFLGFDPGTIDGVLGRRTRNAAQMFREANGLGDSDAVDDDLVAALSAALA
jgi:hypothetical protein